MKLETRFTKGSRLRSGKPGIFSWGLLFTPAVLCSALACGATEDAALFDMSMEQLSQVEIKSDIASIKARPLREQPGIVEVVTSKEIEETGARDLSDILMLVPGFSLDTDVESMVGLTFRGLQGQEGKVLLVVDGIEINEPLYGSLPILNHIPAEAIQQVEIIRGPGSAMYGGTAALSVVRVTTKGAGQNGGYGDVTTGYADGRLDEKVAAGAGYAKGDWRCSLNTAYSDDFLSNRRYTSLTGNSVDLTHRSDMNPLFLDVDGGWRDFDLRLIYDNYHYQDSVNYGEPPKTPIDTRFESLLTSAKYDFHPATWLKVTPQFTYRNQHPWYTTSAEMGDYQIDTDRYQADLNAVAELSANSGLMFGMRYFRDEARAVNTGVAEPAATFYHGQSSVAYNDYAGFAQYDLDTRWVNLSLGGRYEAYDPSGGHFVPRVALTKAWEKFHLKALYSQAARIPGINVVNSAVGGHIEAEETANYEVEAGYRFNDSLSLVGNAYYIQVDKPIIYSANASGDTSDAYYNGSRLSTGGFESELRWNRPRYSAFLGYSYYRALEDDVDYVHGGDDRFLAAPAHKISFSATWHILKTLDWNVNGFWLSERSTYAYPNMGIAELSPEFVLNTFLNYHWRQFSFGVGVANLLDEDRFAPQPYHGSVAPLPLKGREVFARLGVRF